MLPTRQSKANAVIAKPRSGCGNPVLPKFPSKLDPYVASLLRMTAHAPTSTTATINLMKKLLVILICFTLCSCSRPTKCKECMPTTENQNQFPVSSYKDLSKEDQELLDAAEAVMKNSYSPYFHFNVGAALRTIDGEIIAGTNMENAAGTSICAERTAILRANAMGKREFTTMAVIGKPANGSVPEPITPCGFCRQVIFESSQISDTDIKLIMSNTAKDKIIISRISSLLPLAFGPKDLGAKL